MDSTGQVYFANNEEISQEDKERYEKAILQARVEDEIKLIREEVQKREERTLTEAIERAKAFTSRR